MDSVQEFFHMGGYAFYVWTSYGLALVILLFNLINPWLRHRQVRQDLARRERRQRAQAVPREVIAEEKSTP